MTPESEDGWAVILRLVDGSEHRLSVYRGEDARKRAWAEVDRVRDSQGEWISPILLTEPAFRSSAIIAVETMYVFPEEGRDPVG